MVCDKILPIKYGTTSWEPQYTLGILQVWYPDSCGFNTNHDMLSDVHIFDAGFSDATLKVQDKFYNLLVSAQT